MMLRCRGQTNDANEDTTADSKAFQDIIEKYYTDENLTDYASHW